MHRRIGLPRLPAIDAGRSDYAKGRFRQVSLLRPSPLRLDGVKSARIRAFRRNLLSRRAKACIISVMKITLGKKAGFCWGVRRATNMVLDLANDAEWKIYTYGPLIHNPQVLEVLAGKGIVDFCSLVDRSQIDPRSTVLIRAHGVAPDALGEIERLGAHVVDGTCPKVKAVQKIISRYSAEGRHTVIVGDKGHAEVIGLTGYARAATTVISNVSEIECLDPSAPTVVVSQTTMNTRTFGEIAAAIRERVTDVVIKNTICSATEARQDEVRELAANADCVIIVGGKDSGNTRRLAEVAREYVPAVFHIETADELNFDDFRNVDRVAVSAGASTPNWIIVSVLEKLSTFTRKKRRGPVRTLLKIAEFVLMSNLTIAGGAFVASSVVQRFLGEAFNLTFALVSFLYIYSMITLHKYANRESFRLSEPMKLAFYDRYSGPFKWFSVLALLASLAGSFFLSSEVFVFLLICYLGGLVYDRKFIPRTFRKILKFASLRDIPASKTVSVALGFASVTVLLPLLHYRRTYSFEPKHIFIFAFCLILAFARQAFFDIRDTQNDRMVGKETIPTVIGEKWTRYTIYVFLAALLAFAALLDLQNALPLSPAVFVVPIAYLWAFYHFYVKPRTYFDFMGEFWVDMTFYLTAATVMFCNFLKIH